MKGTDSLNIGVPLLKPGTMILVAALKTWFSKYESIFEALWIEVSDTEMLDVFGGDPLVLSVSENESFLPADYIGTITCPNNPILDTADTDNLWFNAGVPVPLSISDLIDTDYNRTIVKYDDNVPHNVRATGILVDGLVITDAWKDMLIQDMDLWAFFFGGWNDRGTIKDNRNF